MSHIQIMNKVKLLSPYSLSLMDLMRLTQMNKTLLDVTCETFDPKLYVQNIMLRYKVYHDLQTSQEVGRTLEL